MGVAKPHRIVLIGLAVAGVSLLIQIISAATVHWRTGLIIETDKMTIGLFQGCIGKICCTGTGGTGSSTGIDSGFGTDSGSGLPLPWLAACEVFCILGILSTIASLVLVLLTCFDDIPVLTAKKALFGLLSPVAAAVGALCWLITFSVYAGEVPDLPNFKLGFSFALAIVACVLNVAAAVALFVGKDKATVAEEEGQVEEKDG